MSALVIVRDGERRLARGIQSILDQTRPVERLVIVVQDSTDRTAQIARSFPEASVIEQRNTFGIAVARNRGIRDIADDWVAFLDHDDIWRNDKLERQLELVAQHRTDVCTGLMRMFVEDRDQLAPVLAQQLDRPVRPGLTPSALLVRRAHFDTVGLFDEQLQIGCDADWIARSDPSTWSSADQIVVDKELHGSNISGDAELNGREMLTLARAHLKRQRDR